MRVILIQENWRNKLTEDDFKYFTGLRCVLEMERICQRNNWPYITASQGFDFLDKNRVIQWLYKLYQHHEQSFENIFMYWEHYPPSLLVSQDLDELIKIDVINISV